MRPTEVLLWHVEFFTHLSEFISSLIIVTVKWGFHKKWHWGRIFYFACCSSDCRLEFEIEQKINLVRLRVQSVCTYALIKNKIFTYVCLIPVDCWFKCVGRVWHDSSKCVHPVCKQSAIFIIYCAPSLWLWMQIQYATVLQYMNNARVNKQGGQIRAGWVGTERRWIYLCVASRNNTNSRYKFIKLHLAVLRWLALTHHAVMASQRDALCKFMSLLDVLEMFCAASRNQFQLQRHHRHYCLK